MWVIAYMSIDMHMSSVLQSEAYPEQQCASAGPVRTERPYATAGAAQIRSDSPFAQAFGQQQTTNHGTLDYGTTNGGVHPVQHQCCTGLQIPV